MHSFIRFVSMATSFFLACSTALGQALLPRIPNEFLTCTVQVDAISATRTNIGTGFLISKQITRNGERTRVIFLVTNKHMVSDWDFDNEGTNYYSTLRIHYYTTNLQPAQVELKTDTGAVKALVTPHPNAKIDVVLIALCNEFSPPIEASSFDVSCLLLFSGTNLVGGEVGDTNYLCVGAQVFALGYPLGLTSLNNNFPIAEPAWIASLPGKEFKTLLRSPKPHGTLTDFEGKIYVINGFLTHGNSGGPILTPQEQVFVMQNGKIGSLKTKNWIIGIESGGAETGQNIVYSSDYILDLVNTFESRVVSVHDNMMQMK